MMAIPKNKKKIADKDKYLSCLLHAVNPETTVFAFDLHNVVFKKKIKEIIIKSMKILPHGPWWHILNPVFWKNLYSITTKSNVAEDIFDKIADLYPDLKPFKPDFISIVNAQLPIKNSIKLLSKLKSYGYNLYILSNIGSQALEELKKKYPDIINYFDGSYIPSIENNYRHKPDIVFFQEFQSYLNKNGQKEKQILFIDDLKKNLSVALKCNIAGIQYKSAKYVITLLNELKVF